MEGQHETAVLRFKSSRTRILDFGASVPDNTA